MQPVNDSPVATFSENRSASEGEAAINGQLTSTDVDASGSPVYALDASSALIEGLSLSTNGQWSFDPSSSAYDSLKAGETQTINVGYVVTDDQEASANGSFSITLTGTNDAPVATFSENRSASEGEAAINGQLTSTDVDASGSPVYALDASSALIEGLSLSTNGQWSFDPSSSAYDSLKAGETQTINVGYVVTDDQEASANGSFSITLTGTNDAPVATFSENRSASEGEAAINGQLTSTDVDASGSPVYALDASSALIEGLSLSTNGQWSFDPSSSAYDSLKAGETQTINVGYVVTDDQEASANGSFSITLTGTNDAPVATFSENRSASEGEAAINGQLTSTDVDASGSPVYALDASSALIEGLSLSTNGQWSFDPSSSAYDSLKAGETQTINVGYVVTDDQEASANGSFSITLTGTNDAPVATFSENRSASEGEAAINGQLTSTDVDASGSPVYALDASSALIEGLSLSTNGQWSFDPSSSAYDSLKAGETQTINVGYVVTDDQEASANGSFSITLTGTNDAPVATFSENRSASEGEAAINGQLTSTDVDASGSPVYALDASSALIEGLSLSTNGQWSFDPSSSAYDSLKAGETQTINVGYVVTDDQEASANGSFSITLTGTNDAPVVTYNPTRLSVSTIEGSSTLQGEITYTDIDGDDGLTTSFKVVDQSGNPTTVDGFTLQDNGAWSFDPKNAAYNNWVGPLLGK